MTAATRRTRGPGRRNALLGLVAIAAAGVVFAISYTALSGLPWEDTYHVSVDLPSADRLRSTDEVRIGGVRVGQVSSVRALPGEDGAPPFARIEIAVGRSVDGLPVDTTARIRPASVLGASYLEITPGASAQAVPEGGVLRQHTARQSVGLVDLFEIFDGSARKNFQSSVRGLAYGLAGRGRQINQTISAFRRLMDPLTSVMATLATPETDLDGFVQGYASAFDALAPARGQLAQLFSGAAGTFGALADARNALGHTLDLAPSAEDATTEAFTRIQPSLRGLDSIIAGLRPAGRLLPSTLSRVNAALRSGVRGLSTVRTFAPSLRTALATLTEISRRSSTSGALRKVGELMAVTDPTLASLADAQVSCNVIPLLGQNFSSYIGVVGTGWGPSFWNLSVSTAGAQTDGVQSAEQAPDLNLNYTPEENSSECESGNEPALDGKQIGNPQGLQPLETRPTEPPPGVHELAVKAGLTD